MYSKVQRKMKLVVPQRLQCLDNRGDSNTTPHLKKEKSH